MTTQTKLTTGLALLAFIGWGAFWAVSKRPLLSPTVTEKIVYQDKVIFKDRIVTKEVIRTETRPDGTKIVTETKSDSKTSTSETTKTKQIERNTPLPKTHYSLGLQVERKLDFDLTKPTTYRAEIGYRLLESPLWVTASYSTDHTASVGLRLEF